MCGITIIWDRVRQKAELACQRATHAQQHRGPDDAGFCTIATPQGWLALGHRRLSILDLSPTGAQPMVDPLTQNAIVFNGEIYNFRELRKQLEAKGAQFRSSSDTEVLLVGYREWGPRVFDLVRGMFAVAIWDAHDKSLVVARDHVGMKPLYLTQKSDQLVIASELTAIMQSGLVERNINRAAVAGLLAYGSVPEPLTMVDEVAMFPAATWARIDLSGVPKLSVQQAYWSLPAEVDPQKNFNFRELLDHSLRGHLESDVPVGVFLSGGIDSTAVAEAAVRQGSGTLQTLTVGFADNPDIDETPLAERTARQLGTEHHGVTVTNDDALAQARAWMDSIDQPCLDGFNTYLVSQAARQVGLKVALSGLGGDELFGGYSTFRTIPRMYRWSRPARIIPESARRWLAYQAFARSLPTVRCKAADMAADIQSLAALVLGRRRLFSNRELRDFDLEAASLGLTAHYLATQRTIPELAASRDLPAAVAAMEASFYMRDTLLRDSDISGMSHSLEIRLPLLDRDLLTAAVQLPAHERMANKGVNKPILVEAGGECTRAVAKLPKRGFSLPYGDWIRGPLEELVRGSAGHVSGAGFLPRRAVEKTLDEFYRNKTSSAPWSRVWALAVLGRWLERSQQYPCAESETSTETISAGSVLSS